MTNVKVIGIKDSTNLVVFFVNGLVLIFLVPFRLIKKKIHVSEKNLVIITNLFENFEIIYKIQLFPSRYIYISIFI